MTIKLTILKNGENIISEVKGVFDTDNKLVCYVLENPCEVVINGSYKILEETSDQSSQDRYSISLIPWPRLSKDKTIEVIPDFVVTIVDPVDSIKKLYETEILSSVKNETNKNISSTEQSGFDI